MLFMKNADQRKCGGSMSNLKEQFGSGHDQCPKNEEGALDALTNHEWDEAHSEHRKNQHEQKKEGHNSKQKEESEEENNLSQRSVGISFAQKGKKACFCCGKEGHLSTVCSEQNTGDKKDWCVHEAVNAHQNRQVSKEDTNSEGNDQQKARNETRIV